MPRFSDVLHPLRCLGLLARALGRWYQQRHPNWRAVGLFPPGHFHSPLLNIEHGITHDGKECWEHVPLHDTEQRRLYRELLDRNPPLSWPAHPGNTYRYNFDNGWFPLADAFTLSALIQRLRPRRIIEVGSGFSTAVMLDTLDHYHLSTALTLIEPDPSRLQTLLRDQDQLRLDLISKLVQDTPVETFDQLEAGDILFIDSSHVAKAGSDVTYLFLRILPRLKPGVWVQVHDIFYPGSYPEAWVKEGRAWNESLFLRVFLADRAGYAVRAFNAYAHQTFPAEFWQPYPAVGASHGCSFWMERMP